MKRSCLSRPALLVLAVSLGGCSLMDPYQKPGVWRPMGANAMNLELQVAHPGDLVQGRGSNVTDGDTAAQAIDRLRHDKVKTLTGVNTMSTAASGTGS